MKINDNECSKICKQQVLSFTLQGREGGTSIYNIENKIKFPYLMICFDITELRVGVQIFFFFFFLNKKPEGMYCLYD